ncbi:MAG: energy transducer TonB [Gammaproteobacteria bacterium]
MKYITILMLSAAFTSPIDQANASETAMSDSESLVIKIDDTLKEYWEIDNRVAPKYPRAALKRQKQGCATVGYVIEADGSTSGHWVIASSPEKIFDRSAIKANKKFSYKPGSQNENNQPVMTINTFTYSLGQGGAAPGKEIADALEKMCRDAAVSAIKAKYGPL